MCCASVSFLRPFCWQAAMVLDACGFIVRQDGADRPHEGEWKVREFVAAMEDFSLFKRLLSLTIGTAALPVDVRCVFTLIDEARDNSKVPYTVSTRTVHKILKAELVPSVKNARRKLLSYFDWGTLFALIAAGLDERFGLEAFNVHPTRDDAAHAALRFLLSNRPTIEVRSFRLCVCGAGARCVCCLPVLRSCERLSARVSAPAFRRAFVCFCSAF